MKIIMKVVKNICLGIFSIYSINVLFSSINIYIPINLCTLFISSVLGIYGVITVLVIKLII